MGKKVFRKPEISLYLHFAISTNHYRLAARNIKWRDVRSGAIFTAVLFMIGRLVIGIYISNTSSSYGAAGSLIIILLWIYYTAAILYFGAEFTRAYADFYGIKIEPAEFAVHIEQTERAKKVRSVPPKHNIGKSNK